MYHNVLDTATPPLLSTLIVYGHKLTPLFARNGISHKNRCRNDLRTQIAAPELHTRELRTGADGFYFSKCPAPAAGWTSGLSSSRSAAALSNCLRQMQLQSTRPPANHHIRAHIYIAGTGLAHKSGALHHTWYLASGLGA